MIFTSYTYVAFLLVAFVIHWLLPAAWRKRFLIVASYVFYCTWKWEFAFLLLGLSVFNWSYARWVLARAESTGPLVVGVVANLAALVYFKYTNFIVVNAAAALGLFGAAWRPALSDIVLPLGISFFTFQGVAYLFDVATGEEPLESFTDFLFFKAFWPQLIAGPIIRLSEIREQIATERTIVYDDFAEGSRRILHGFFKKVVLADNLAPSVDMVFRSAVAPNALDAVVGILGFGLQIYFDFSAYSDIAIGTARLFGYRFPENFDWPYVSTSPQEFWNRWHMTLSRWIRDYLFTPMAFAARRRPRLAPLWLLIAMALCGLWHGAQWTFVLWGVWHGVLLLLNQTVLKRVFVPADETARVSVVRRLAAWAVTFIAVQAGWALFRAGSIEQAMGLWRAILTMEGGLRPAIIRENIALLVFAMTGGLMIAQLLRGRLETFFHNAGTARWGGIVRPLAYAALIIAIVVFDQEARSFVYFQF